MSIEQLLADQIAATNALTVAVNENTAALKVLDAGRTEALDQLKAAGTGTAAPRRTRAAKADEPAPTPTPAAAAETVAGYAPDTSDDAIRAMLTGWLKEKSIDAAEVTKRGDTFKAMLAHFGSPAAVGEKSTLDSDQRHQLVFFLTRFQTNLPVDFSADYDFGADPLAQGESLDLTAADDDEMIG